ncbi:unnamed protein product [Mytilus coruscus]|uniref:SRCR domain-containing protein n=1 Tax=Mytilus coruscus TaxID=42192 RepID=A0A6J8BQE1_MYTCO|nr:unnamed protein product [Mytilus coruscus]
MIVLKFIFLVYLSFLTFGNIFALSQSRTIILCEDEKTNISCVDGNISIEKVIFPLQRSQCSTTLRNCNDKTRNIQSTCNGKKWCAMETNAFIKGHCTKVPRHMVLNYACSHIDFWNRRIQNNQGRVVCGSLKDVQCHYTDVISSSEATYDYDYDDSCEKPVEKIQECLSNGIKSACDNKYQCDEKEITNTYCFFMSFSIEITYSCDQDTKYYMQVKLDNDMRVLIYDESQNKSFVLCPNMWTDTHATIVCRQFNLSDIGLAIKVTREEKYKQLHSHVNCSGNESTLLLCRFDRSSQRFCENSDSAVRCTTLNKNPVSSTEVMLTPDIHSNTTGTAIGVISSIVFIATVAFVIIIICRIKKRSKYNSGSNISAPINYQNVHRSDGLSEGVLPSHCYMDLHATDGSNALIAANAETGNTSYPINVPQRGNLSVDYSHGMERIVENNYFLIEPSELEATMNNSYSDIDNPVASSSSFRLQQNSLNQNDYFVLDPRETERSNNANNYSEIEESSLITAKAKKNVLTSNNYDHYAISKEGVYDETNNRRHVNQDDFNIYDRSLDDAYDSMTFMRTKTLDITYDHLKQTNNYNDRLNN